MNYNNFNNKSKNKKGYSKFDVPMTMQEKRNLANIIKSKYFYDIFPSKTHFLFKKLNLDTFNFLI